MSGVNTSYGNGEVIKAGTLNATTSGSALGTGTVTLGDTGGSANATLEGATFVFRECDSRAGRQQWHADHRQQRQRPRLSAGWSRWIIM